MPGTVSFVGRPTASTPFWEIDLDTDYGSTKYRAIYHSDRYVLIDLHDVSHVSVIKDMRDEPAANRVLEKYFEPAHFG